MSFQESINTLQREVIRLRQERKLVRKKVSETAADIVYYCKRHAKDDYFLQENHSNNPYREGKQCAVM